MSQLNKGGKASAILGRVVLVKVEANIYGARKKLKKEDLVLADGSILPPEDLASLGSKRLLDPEKLTVFNRLKKEAERICLRVGTRLLGGFAIPTESVASITDGLERIAQDFTEAKAQFLAGYDAAVTDWVVRHPEFAGIIEQAVDSVEYVSTRLSFDYLVVTVGLPEILPEKELARLETKVSTLSGQMFYEISVEASQLIEQSLLGKDQVTRNALRPIRRMRDKLDGLSFLDHRVAPIVSSIDHLLARIPNKGAIEGSLLQEILATTMLLTDPDKTQRHGEGLLAAQAGQLSPLDTIADDIEIVAGVSDVVNSEPFDEENASPTLTIDSTLDAITVEETDDWVPAINEETEADLEDFADLFDGIFDEEIEFDEIAEDWTGVLLTKDQVSEKLERDAVLPSQDKTNQQIANCDYWF